MEGKKTVRALVRDAAAKSLVGYSRPAGVAEISMLARLADSVGAKKIIKMSWLAAYIVDSFLNSTK